MKKNKLLTAITLLVIFIVFFNSCGTEPGENKNEPPTIDIPPAISYHSPAWHPNNKFIGFNYTPITKIVDGKAYFNSNLSGFWLVNINGSNQRRIFSRQLQTPEWSHDGKWIAFVMGAQIYKMPFNDITETFDTTQVIQLTTEGRNFFPSWSPDDKWIAYDSNIDSPNGMNFIWKMKSDGTENIRIAYDPGNGEIRMPAWGSDSSIAHIRYILNNNGAPEIFMMNNNGNNVQQLTKNKTIQTYPQYSPVGNIIAFFSSNKKHDLWIINLETHKQEIIVNNIDDYKYCWSLDGKKIVYLAENSNKNCFNVSSLWIIDIYFGVKYQLTFNKKGG